MTPRQIGAAAVIAGIITGATALARHPDDGWPVASHYVPNWVIGRQPDMPQRFVRDAQRQAVVRAVVEEAQAQGVPVAFALAVTHQESRFNATAIGPPTRYGRAYGPTQLLVPTARGMGYRGDARGLLNPRTGAHYGVRYMANALRECRGDVECAARRYHGGSNRRIWGPRTHAYGRAVVAHTRRFGGVQTAQLRLSSGCPTADDRFPHTWGCR